MDQPVVTNPEIQTSVVAVGAVVTSVVRDVQTAVVEDGTTVTIQSQDVQIAAVEPQGAQAAVQVPDIHVVSAGAQGPAGAAPMTYEQAMDLINGGDTVLHQHTRYMDVAVYDSDQDGVVDQSENVVIRVRNATGSTIAKGAAVFISGATGQRPTITLARADAEATSSKTIGLVSTTLPNNTDGFAIVIGALSGVNTSAFNDGDPLWLSATVAGGVVNSPPADPNHTVFIGYCAYSQNNNGIIVINIQNGYELSELHDVSISAPADNDAVAYDAATGLFKNRPLISNHEAAVDPHPQYVLDTEKAAPNGVATLDVSSHVLTSQVKWPMVSDTIDVGEEVVVPPTRQLIIAGKITNNGALLNSGKVYLI